MPDTTSDLYAFRSEFISQGFKTFLQIQNKIKVRTSEGKEKIISTIDIDVSNKNFECTSIKDVIDEATKIHNVEKEIFFSLIREDFLEQLNPKY